MRAALRTAVKFPGPATTCSSSCSLRFNFPRARIMAAPASCALCGNFKTFESSSSMVKSAWVGSRVMITREILPKNSFYFLVEDFLREQRCNLQSKTRCLVRCTSSALRWRASTRSPISLTSMSSSSSAKRSSNFWVVARRSVSPALRIRLVVNPARSLLLSSGIGLKKLIYLT